MGRLRVRGWGLIALYGLILGLLLVGIKLMEFSYFAGDITMEIYLGLVAVTFLVIGLAVGRRNRAKSSEPTNEPSAPLPTSRVGVYGSLSEREVEVLQRVAKGETNREIAERLFLSPDTIKSHVSNIYRKLDVNRRAQAVARAKELEII